jgi:geranylgeranyl diphosphate synthase type I
MNHISGFSDFASLARPALREELSRVVSLAEEHGAGGLKEIITYQLGWSGEKAGPKAEGKAIRPLLVLLACEGGGGDWKSSLPAAAAVELVHNFSLIHDDIEDGSDLRRGRPAVWKLWGEAQAINAGDAIFALANLSLANLEATVSAQEALEAARLFHATCLRLTQGQYLDISFEKNEDIELECYWLMVGGKTAALLAFCLEVGALCARVAPPIRSQYRDFGHNLGLAFQVQDDILGIWGDEELSGKSSASDLITRKKTLPVLYGLAQKKAFYQAWTAGPAAGEDIPALAGLLESEGARAYAQSAADRVTDLALAALEKAHLQQPAGRMLEELAHQLLQRQE